jgi:septal ring factor EnvC (AmiA/AmiB activator)
MSEKTGGSALALMLLVALGAVVPLAGQEPRVNQDLLESQRRLDSIRTERGRLRMEQLQLEGRVKDVGAELRNIERQRESTHRIVNEIDLQIGGLNNNLSQVSAELVLAQDNLAQKRAVLQRRLVDIYKRGPLYTFQALLAAESFGDLLSRYKYLFTTSQQDRALLGEVENLRDRVIQQRNDLLLIKTDLDRSKTERQAELSRYSQLMRERERQLRRLQRTGRTTEERLTSLERDEAALNNLIARLRTAAASGAPAPGGLTTADIGNLDWPVEGRILYNFGRVRLPSGAIVRRNGIGIGAQVGETVHAVDAGRVLGVQQVGTYGLMVLIQHGTDHISTYGQLSAASVRPGDRVVKGQVIGTVGGQNTNEGPHLYFEIRGPEGIALDPTGWLTRRRR